VGPRAGLDATENVKILPLPEIEPRTSSLYPSLYRDVIIFGKSVILKQERSCFYRFECLGLAVTLAVWTVVMYNAELAVTMLFHHYQTG
jgi:hypothetical protein